MNYHARHPFTKPITVGLIGTGAYGNSFLYQSRSVPRLRPVAVCDLSVDTAHTACLKAGWPDEALAHCATSGEAQSAFEADKTVLVEDAKLLMGLPIDAVVEATGSPEAGAFHAHTALAHGKHVVMVTKETDCVVGPILAKTAAENGLVYTQADGDQPSMLIGLISWAQTLGLEIICAGKSSESDVVYDVASGVIANSDASVQLEEDGLWTLWELGQGSYQEMHDRRRQALQELIKPIVADLCEMAMVMNSTGYGFDNPSLHAPVLRIPELAEVWGLRSEGGILDSTDVIDVVHCLRRSDEVSLAGGVFVVFACHDAATWQLLRDKGHVVSRDLARAAVFVPYHLLGVETATSVLSAVDLKQPTGGQRPRQLVDVCAVATEPLSAGQRLNMGKGHAIGGTRPELMTSRPISRENAIPYYMAADQTLAQDVAAGTVLTYAHIVPDQESALWALKRTQDAVTW